VCAAVRSDDDPELAATPIIILSAKAQQADVDEGLRVGATSYVTKPFDPVELVRLVDRLGSRAG
jgi:DNA-binding response OmpR family regulator